MQRRAAMTWAQRLQRVFGIDIETCPACGGALRLVVLIGTPAMVGLLVLAGPILATLFQHGAFSARDVHMASLSLMAYASGLLGFILVKVLAPGTRAWEQALLLVRLYDALCERFRCDGVAMYHWLRADSKGLGGVPLLKIVDEDQLKEVVEYVEHQL